MTLARSWTRHLCGASGAALLVPGTIAGALVILAFAGGFARLGSLGQALSGPSLPGPTRVSGTLAGSEKSALGRALAAAATPAGAATATPVAAASGASAASGAVGGAAPGVGGSRSGGIGSGSSGRGGSGAPGGTGGTGSPGGGGSGSLGGGSGGSGGAGSPPPTSAPPTAVGTIVGVATSLTRQVPGPVGTVATQTLQSVGSTVDRVLPLGGSATTVASKLGLLP